MSDQYDSKFWLRMIGLIVAIIFLGIGSCSCIQNYQDNTAIVQMVNHGSTPMSARCAIRGSAAGGECSIVASQGK